MLDCNQTGKVDFRQFIYAMNILKAGSLEQRLKFAFNAYDLDHNNLLDRVLDI